jgi:hypothetical protein
MRQIRRMLPLLLVLGIGLVILAPGLAGAATTSPTCVAPVATDFRTPSGGIDTAAYLAAVAAYNQCVAGNTASNTPAATTVPAKALAFTGSNSTELAAIALAVVGLGAGAVLVSRRRAGASVD